MIESLLPVDLLRLCFDTLSGRQLAEALRVCQRWCAVASEPQFWRAPCLKRWPFLKDLPVIDWKSLYVKRRRLDSREAGRWAGEARRIPGPIAVQGPCHWQGSGPSASDFSLVVRVEGGAQMDGECQGVRAHLREGQDGC